MPLNNVAACRSGQNRNARLLNPRVTGIVEREGYQIENVIFDSRPDFPVTANLYLPKGPTGPHCLRSSAPAGIRPTARRPKRISRSLKDWRGWVYVCLIYDPIGQGERLQYVKDDLSSRLEWVYASICTPATSSSWSANSSACGGPGMASGPRLSADSRPKSTSGISA